MQSDVGISLHTVIYSIQRPIVCKDVMRYNCEPCRTKQNRQILKIAGDKNPTQWQINLGNKRTNIVHCTPALLALAANDRLLLYYPSRIRGLILSFLAVIFDFSQSLHEY